MSAPSGSDRDDQPRETADDREWEVSLDDLERDTHPTEPSIEPGSPSIENSAFVVVGVLLTLVVLFGGF